MKKDSLKESFPEALSFSEEGLNYLVDEAIEICFMFNIGISNDFNSTIEINGVQWSKVNRIKIWKAWKNLRNIYRAFFVDNTVYEEYYIDQIFQEFDGELYTSRLGEMGTLIRYMDESPELIEVRKQENMLVFRKKYYEGDYEIPQFIEIEVVYNWKQRIQTEILQLIHTKFTYGELILLHLTANFPKDVI